MRLQANVAVIYYSATGSVHTLAEAEVAGAEAAGAQVRLRRVAEIAPAEAVASNPQWQGHQDSVRHIPLATAFDVLWADAIIFGTPTRYGNVSAQLKAFIDSLGPQWAQGQLADKVYSGFTAAATAHGGHEATLLALYASVHHFGGVVVAPGYADPIQFAAGNPYGASHISNNGQTPVGGDQLAAALFQGGRVARMASALKTGLAP